MKPLPGDLVVNDVSDTSVRCLQDGEEKDTELSSILSLWCHKLGKSFFGLVCMFIRFWIKIATDEKRFVQRSRIWSGNQREMRENCLSVCFPHVPAVRLGFVRGADLPGSSIVLLQGDRGGHPKRCFFTEGIPCTWTSTPRINGDEYSICHDAIQLPKGLAFQGCQCLAMRWCCHRMPRRRYIRRCWKRWSLTRCFGWWFTYVILLIEEILLTSWGW